MRLRFHLKSFYQLLKTAEFSKGILFGVAAVVPLLITGYFGKIELGVPMAIGVLLTSPSDVPGSLKRRIIGVSLSIIMAVIATIIASYAAVNAVLFFVVLVVLMFGFSMISVYGFRASLIAFSGLFAVVLSMARVPSGGGVISHALLIGAGGLWYLGLTILMHYLNRRKHTDTLLAETFDLTAEYLEIRVELLYSNASKQEELQKELINLQTSLNEKHEIIREMLITRRRNFGRSGVMRKRLLIFMELIDILELGMANPVNYGRMKILFADHPEKIQLLKDWSFVMAEELKKIAQAWKRQGTFKTSEKLHIQKREIWQALRGFENEAQTPQEREALLVYQNLLALKEKQYQKILSIERLLREWEGSVELKLKRKDAIKFLTTPDYNLKTLQDHFDLQSPIFRHALRLTVAMVVGLLLGRLFEFQNQYWILLTTLVIMRPGYALTRDRFKQRLYGTLIGGAVAVTIVLLIQNKVFYGILAIISLVLAFSTIQRNYKTAAAFITLNVVFVYSLLKPNALEVIEYRVLDTILGAGLAFLASKFLWPTWEYTSINNYIKDSIQANINYLKEIENLYKQKKKVPPSYRLARKQAFLAMGDLSAAFQRMAQEPKTGKELLGETFRIVSLNQEFLSSTASLGTYIRSHATTSTSVHFHNYIKAIQQNLEISIGKTSENPSEEKKLEVQKLKNEIKEAEVFYEELYESLIRSRQEENFNANDSRGKQLQEVQMVMDQLKGLREISENLKKSVNLNAK